MTNKNQALQKIANVLDLPTEALVDVTKILVSGSSNIYIENYKGLVEMQTQQIVVKTYHGVLKIIGNKLDINFINNKEISISGDITTLENII